MSAGDTAESASASPAPPLSGTAAFLDALRACLDERRADGRDLALLLVDCGVIGRLDAAWGYHVGDAVRSRISAALRAGVLRPSDIIGDLGRDDFACVLSPLDGPAVALLAADKSLRALGSPFWIGEDEVYASPAIGIAIFPAHADQAELLLQHAKDACTVARNEPGHVFIHADDRENPAAAELLRENRLRAAVCDDALELAFQPQYDLQLGQMMGVESLLHWRGAPQRGVPAVQAFAAAQSAGRVTDLLSSVLNRALRNCSEFRYSAGLDLRIGVNVPGRVLLHPEIPDVVARALGTWGLRPGRLIIEVDEVSVLSTEPAAQDTLAQLKEIGVKLSIDDASLALSSLFWLAPLAFQEVKFDVGYARDLAEGSKSERIVQTMIELARSLDLEVVATHVASEAAAERLKALGCNYMQADYRGAAMEAKSFVKWFESGEA